MNLLKNGAKVRALRETFVEDLAGMYEAEEMQQEIRGNSNHTFNISCILPHSYTKYNKYLRSFPASATLVVRNKSQRTMSNLTNTKNNKICSIPA